jgi:hypothetical protein
MDYARWRETIGALKREGIVDQACARLRDRMDLAGDDSLDWLLLLQLLNPEEHSEHARHRRRQRCEAVRLDARAKVTDKPIGRKKLARATRVPETTIQSWRNHPDYQRDVDRAVEIYRASEGPKRWVAQRRGRRDRRDADGG